MPFTSGWTMEPPAEREYAVLPVGEEISRPSAMAVVRGRPFRVMVRWARWGDAPRWSRISLRAWWGGGLVRELSVRGGEFWG